MKIVSLFLVTLPVFGKVADICEWPSHDGLGDNPYPNGISCEADEKIVIRDAVYGRPFGGNHCTANPVHVQHNICRNSNSLTVSALTAFAKADCDFQQSCQFRGNNKMAGNPCPNHLHKYTRVTFWCIKENVINEALVKLGGEYDSAEPSKNADLLEGIDFSALGIDLDKLDMEMADYNLTSQLCPDLLLHFDLTIDQVMAMTLEEMLSLGREATKYSVAEKMKLDEANKARITEKNDKVVAALFLGPMLVLAQTVTAIVTHLT